MAGPDMPSCGGCHLVPPPEVGPWPRQPILTGAHFPGGGRTPRQDICENTGKIGFEPHRHPQGFNNNFHIRTTSYLATLYNDRSILENHHCTCIFDLVKSGAFPVIPTRRVLNSSP